MIIISASSLKDYLECKYKYHYRYNPPEVELYDSVPLVKGRAVHNAIELLESSGSAYSEVVTSMMSELYEELAKPNVVFSRWDSVKKVIDSSQKMLRSYVDNRRGVVKESEISFEHELTTIDGIPFKMIGRIDQVVDMGGEEVLVDLKTSRTVPTEFEIHGDYQFTMYVLAHKLSHDYMPTIYNFHLNSGRYIEYPRGSSDIKELKVKLDQVVFELDQIKEWQEYHKDKGWHCNRCPFREPCYGLHEKEWF